MIRTLKFGLRYDPVNSRAIGNRKRDRNARQRIHLRRVCRHLHSRRTSAVQPTQRHHIRPGQLAPTVGPLEQDNPPTGFLLQRLTNHTRRVPTSAPERLIKRRCAGRPRWPATPAHAPPCSTTSTKDETAARAAGSDRSPQPAKIAEHCGPDNNRNPELDHALEILRRTCECGNDKMLLPDGKLGSTCQDCPDLDTRQRRR